MPITKRLILCFPVIFLCFTAGTVLVVYMPEDLVDKSSRLSDVNMSLALAAADMKL